MDALPAKAEDATVVAVNLVGRLPEVAIHLSNGLHVLSYMTAEGDPDWGLLSHREGEVRSVGVRAGRLVLTSKPFEVF